MYSYCFERASTGINEWNNSSSLITNTFYIKDFDKIIWDVVVSVLVIIDSE
jgi:hypothetical protein